MNKLNIFPIYDKFFKVKESYQQNFNSLTEEELTGLQRHSFFLDKVHKEMKGCDNEPDIDSFNRNLEVIQHKGQGFRELYSSAFKKDSVEAKSYFTDIVFEKSKVTSAEFTPIWMRLAEKSDKDVWSKIHNCMYENTDTLKLQSVKSLVKGLSLKGIDSSDRTEGAKLVYEVAKTVSTFSNAAIAGALEPKQSFLSNLIDTEAISKLIKDVKKNNFLVFLNHI